MSTLLVIDDDRSVHQLVRKALSDSEIKVVTAIDAADGLEKLKTEKPDALLLDIMLPGTTGIELAKHVREIDVKLPVIFITVTEDSGMAIEAMKMGAYEYVLKPLGVQQIQELVVRALEMRRLMQAPVHLDNHEPTAEIVGDLLVGRSPLMLEVYKQIGRVAAQNVAVLIRGESGTGKELIARAIYQHSHRRDFCFLAVNCAALTDTLLESELFGHEKGSFTGAERRHIGKFEQCADGTIFLDEVGDMSPLTQSKVLRLLQDQRFERVGGKETIQVDVRLISATNRPLEQMIEDGQFRLDLFHRLNAFEIYLPPLRDRGDDILLLIEHFLARFNRTLGKNITGISPEALQIFTSYHWPGNIRELQSVLRKTILMATGPVLVPEFIPRELTRSRETTELSAAKNGDSDLGRFLDEREASGSEELYAEALEWMERQLLTRVLESNGGNQSKAAEQLGITRGSLRNKLRTLGISIGQVVNVDGDEVTANGSFPGAEQ